MESYKRHLIETIGMNEANADLFLTGFEKVNYEKGDFLIKKGDKCNIVRVILNGCARGFEVVDGEEVTTDFYFENDHSYDYVNYMLCKPSELNIQALSPITMIEIASEKIDFFNSKILGFYKMGINILIYNIIKINNQRKGFILNTPRERYLELLKNNKQIISRVTQHQVASYIGITPQHLSRIRKEISTS